MKSPNRLLAILALLCLPVLPATARATDVDGPNDCERAPVDYGDAPEGVQAYPGVIGNFPTCLAAGPVGTLNLACSPGAPPPGPTGFVRHVHQPAIEPSYWLGCGPAGVPPLGIDSDHDGKTNDVGAGASACDPTEVVDCVEAAFGMSFGQDECYGTDDAGVAAAVSFAACASTTVAYRATYCGPGEKVVYLNVLVDWNADGDWNDEIQCPGACVREWAVQNAAVVLQTGCNLLTTPAIAAGPVEGPGWMRITLSDEPAPPEFAWNGSAGIPGGSLTNGETEDYPVRIGTPPPPCPPYEDWGDAPEEAQAYPGILGHFPTCGFASGPGTFDVDCVPPLSTPPGPTGYVRHVSAATDNLKFWLGCGLAGGAGNGVDGEPDGKMNDTGGPFSTCATNLAVDCTQFLGLTWGQDECYGDADAGIAGPRLIFKTCQEATVDFSAFNCGEPVDAFLNILVDWNEDGDWNDNFRCGTAANPVCAYEWAVKNVPIALAPGCQALTSPAFRVGPKAGKGWLRITLTAAPVSDDFPWDGSAGPLGDGFFRAGETEDYPVVIRPDNVGVEDAAGTGSLMFAPLTPNPASKDVQLRFTLPAAADVSLAVYDIAGRRVAELANGRREAGEHRMSWNFQDASGRSMPAGQYVLRLRVGGRVLTQRVMRVP